MTEHATESNTPGLVDDDPNAGLKRAVGSPEAGPPPLPPDAEPVEAGPRRRLLVMLAAGAGVLLLWMLFRSAGKGTAGTSVEGGNADPSSVEAMANEGDPSWMKAVDTTMQVADSGGSMVPPVFGPPGAAPYPQPGAVADSGAGGVAATQAPAGTTVAPTEDPRRQSFLAALRSKPLQAGAAFAPAPDATGGNDEIAYPPSLAEMEAAAHAEAERRSVSPQAGFAAAGTPVDGVPPTPGTYNSVPAASSRSSYVTGGAGPAPQQAAPSVLSARSSATTLGGLVVPMGTVIEGQLHTAVTSDLPGSVVGMVTRNVYDAAQRVVVIPRYSWLFGTYESDVAAGQVRLVVQWTAVRFPSGETYELPALRAGDLTGASGLPARVDNHYGRVFGHAILSSIIAAGFQSGGAAGEPASRRDAMADAAAQQLGQTASEVTRRNLSIKPTLRRLHMTRFLIIVDRDLVFTPPSRH